MSLEKYIKYAIIIAGTVLTLFLLPYALNLFLPFILAFVVAVMCQKPLKYLSGKGMSRGIGSALLVTALVSVLIFFIFFLGYQLTLRIKSFLSSLPDIIAQAKSSFSFLCEKLPILKNYSLTDLTKNLFPNVSTKVFSFMSVLPSALMFSIMFILSLFFFIKDYKKVTAFIKEALPPKVIKKILYIKNTVFDTFFSYIRVQLIIMSMTFLVVSLALWILKVDYPVVIGFITGLVDALPIFGTGIILIPWAVFSFLKRDIFLGIGLVILQVIVFLVRELAEPKLMSTHLGLHPILSLISLYIGLKYFGVLGAIITPVLMIIPVRLIQENLDKKKKSA